MLQTQYNVLIVDDHPFTIKILTKILEKQNYRVHGFTDPHKALASLDERGEDIDLVISDIVMGDMSGIDLLRTVKDQPSLAHIPFVFLSATDNDALQQEAFSLGAIDFFEKPVNTNLFVSKLESILKNIALNNLSSNILLTGTKDTLTPTDILEYCAMEKISGYVYFQNSALETTLFFENGLLEHAGEGRELSSEFDMLQEWKSYTFLISRGKPNLQAVRLYLKQEKIQPNHSVALEKFERIFNQFRDLKEIFYYRDAWKAVRNHSLDKMGSLLNNLHKMNQLLARNIGGAVIYNSMHLTNNQVILMLRYQKNDLAFLFKNEEGCQALLSLWQGGRSE